MPTSQFHPGLPVGHPLYTAHSLTMCALALVFLLVALAPLVGCDSAPALSDPDPDRVETVETDTTEPSDPVAEEPPEGQPDAPPQPSENAMPDSSLTDVNANSARFNETVSPRDYLGWISAWYFGHST